MKIAADNSKNRMPARAILAILILALMASSATNLSADSYSELEQRITGLARHDGVYVTEIGRSLQDRPIFAVILTSKRHSAQEFGDALRILIISGQHGDELTPVKAALSSIDDLVSGRTNLADKAREQVVMVFVPVVNPDGYAAGRRRNAANVDLNRNWGTCDQPETAAVARLVENLRPHVFIDQHEWVTLDTQRPNCIEVAGFGTDPQFKLARLLAAAGGQSSPLLSSTAYSKTCNPGLAHRHFAMQGICSMLIETDPDLPEMERIQAYTGLVIATANALAGDDMRIRLELAAMSQTEDNPWLMAVCSKNVSRPPAEAAEFPGRAGLCLAAMAGLLAWTFRLNTARRSQPSLELAAIGPRTIRTFTVSELIQSDLAPSQKLAIIQRYRLRPSDRISARGIGIGG